LERSVVVEQPIRKYSKVDKRVCDSIDYFLVSWMHKVIEGVTNSNIVENGLGHVGVVNPKVFNLLVVGRKRVPR
jgi:hypothetical protein